jgi:hypothetical protein
VAGNSQAAFVDRVNVILSAEETYLMDISEASCDDTSEGAGTEDEKPQFVHSFNAVDLLREPIFCAGPDRYSARVPWNYGRSEQYRPESVPHTSKAG